MAACDICNAVMSLDEGTVYTADELQELIARGFEPPETLLQTAIAAGWSKQQVIARWRQELDTRPQPYWSLCPACAARAAQYMPRPAAAPAAPTAPEAAAPSPEEEAQPTPAVPEAPAEAVAVAPAEPAPVEAPAPAAPAEGEAQPLPQPQPGEKKGLAGRGLLVVLLIVLAVGIGAGLLISSKFIYPSTPVAWSTKTATPLPTQPTATPTLTPSPKPTNTPAPTPLPDLAGTALQQEDLPEGFVAMAEADKEALGITETTMISAFQALFQAPPRYLTVFTNNSKRNLNFAATFLIYPLSPSEQGSFDSYVSDPAVGVKILSAGLTEQGWASPSLLDEEELAKMSDLGDGSIGMIVTGTGDWVSLRMKIAIIRRGAVIEALLVGYRTKQPLVDLGQLAATFDGRVAAAWGGHPGPSPTPR